METISLIGSVAAVLTTISFVPQAIQTIKTKDTSGISLSMYAMFVTGVILWAIYGLLTAQLPLILANTITLFFAGVVLVYKIKSKLNKGS